MEQWIVWAFQKICHNGCLETSYKMKHPIYIVIQLLLDWTAYQLSVLVNECLEFSIVNGFVSAIFIEKINCVGELLNRHLKMPSTIPELVSQMFFNRWQLCTIWMHHFMHLDADQLWFSIKYFETQTIYIFCQIFE